MLIKTLKAGNMNVSVYDTRKEMGKRVAEDFSAKLKEFLAQKEEINIIFAAAPSQLDFLSALTETEGIEWNRVNVFHMDEYVGLGIEREQSFARFIKTNIVDRFPVKAFYPIDGAAINPEKECERYSEILRKFKTDIVCLGIGENGHIAFNDPWEAKFWDEKDVKVVQLDETCRTQQVHDQCFDHIDDVPKFAITLTIPTLLRADAMFCTVPAATKANAVARTVKDDISEDCPATILKAHKNVQFYCDADSGKYLL